jgi:hypothetical protein
MMYKRLTNWLASLALPCAFGLQQAQASIHLNVYGLTTATLPIEETRCDACPFYGDILGKASADDIAWKQGVDHFSELDNPMLVGGEHHASNTIYVHAPTSYLRFSI